MIRPFSTQWRGRWLTGLVEKQRVSLSSLLVVYIALLPLSPNSILVSLYIREQARRRRRQRDIERDNGGVVDRSKQTSDKGRWDWIPAVGSEAGVSLARPDLREATRSCACQKIRFLFPPSFHPNFVQNFSFMLLQNLCIQSVESTPFNVSSNGGISILMQILFVSVYELLINVRICTGSSS